MKAIRTHIPEVMIFEPEITEDERGFSFENFNAKTAEKQIGHPINIVEERFFYSPRYVLRGLHYQPQDPQGIFLSVNAGEVYAVAIDFRKSSPTFHQWAGTTLKEENHLVFWIPEGFAYGYVVLSKSAKISMKMTTYTNSKAKQVILWNDPALKVHWPITVDPVLSVRDRKGKPLKPTESSLQSQ